MPYKEKPTEKLFYSIGEVAEMFKVNTSLIRYWDKEFDILNPQKNKKGNRFFTKADIENFQIIYHLVKEKGFTLEGAKKKIAENKDEAMIRLQLAKTLNNIKSFLKELQDYL